MRCLAVSYIGDDAGVAELGEQLRLSGKTRCLLRFARLAVRELERDEVAAVSIAR